LRSTFVDLVDVLRVEDLAETDLGRVRRGDEDRAAVRHDPEAEEGLIDAPGLARRTSSMTPPVIGIHDLVTTLKSTQPPTPIAGSVPLPNPIGLKTKGLLIYPMPDVNARAV